MEANLRVSICITTNELFYLKNLKRESFCIDYFGIVYNRFFF